MPRFFNYPTPEQMTLDKAMARANSRKSSKSFVQWLAHLFTAAKQSKRAADRERMRLGNVDER